MVIYRTIVESSKVTEALQDAHRKWPRIDDAWEGITWRITRGAQEGYKIGENAYIMRFPNEPLAEVPSITVLYQYTENEVSVLNIAFDL